MDGYFEGVGICLSMTRSDASSPELNLKNGGGGFDEVGWLFECKMIGLFLEIRNDACLSGMQEQEEEDCFILNENRRLDKPIFQTISVSTSHLANAVD